jgi:prevent-host-death family protein
MATATLAGSLGLFEDQMYSSTDLNRRAGEVLNHARKGPVTISRNGEQFALLRREQAANLVKAVLQFGPTLDLLTGALAVVEQKEPPAAFGWLKAFDTDDLRKMVGEVLAASIIALRDTGDWDAVNAIIHQWHESGLVAMSGILDEAMQTPDDGSLEPLPDPRTLVDSDKESQSDGL